MSRDWQLYADDIVEAWAKIQRFLHGISYEAFVGDERTRDAVIRNIEIIGEAAKNLPVHITAQAPHIEWRKVCGMRDVLAHSYFGVDLDFIWSTATTRIAGLEAAVRSLLAAHP